MSGPRVTVVDENRIDILLPGSGGLRRTDLLHHFDAKMTPLQAEFGISFLVEVDRRGRTWRYLFDAGLTGGVLSHNMHALGIDPNSLDAIVISHGHPDHFGGVFLLLEEIDHIVPVFTHEDAFLPRNILFPDGCVSLDYNIAFTPEALESRGGRLVLTKEPTDIGPGIVLSGEIPRANDFEGPLRENAGGARLLQMRGEGQNVTDEVWDEIALYVNVPDLGTLTLTGCAHAGPINSVQFAQKLFGPSSRPLGLMGGLHLGFSGVPEWCIDRTMEEFRNLEPVVVAPGHCSGLSNISRIAQSLPEAFVESNVGVTLDIEEFVSSQS